MPPRSGKNGHVIVEESSVVHILGKVSIEDLGKVGESPLKAGGAE